MSCNSEAHRNTRRYEFYRDGFRIMLPVFVILTVFAAVLSVALSMSVLAEQPTVGYATENGKITRLPVYEDPRVAAQNGAPAQNVNTQGGSPLGHP